MEGSTLAMKGRNKDLDTSMVTTDTVSQASSVKSVRSVRSKNSSAASNMMQDLKSGSKDGSTHAIDPALVCIFQSIFDRKY